MTFESSFCDAGLREETEDKTPVEDDPDSTLAERLFTFALISQMPWIPSRVSRLP
jgi:hypothetical protein